MRVNAFSTHRDHRHLLFCSIVLFLVKVAFITWTPLRALVMSPWLIDDSFIVARVARNIALGHGFSFDGVHTTTGVSMLWTYLTSIDHLLFAKETAVKATLVLSTLFGSLCTIATFLIGKKLGGARAAWIAFVLVSLMPVLFFNAMNGMETSFFSLFIILTIATGSGTWTISPDAFKQGLWIGLFAGIAIMTRADAIFLIGAYLLMQACRWIFDRSHRSTLMRETLGFALSMGLCFGILLIWQMLQSGSPFPDNQIGRRAIALQKHGFDYAHFSLPAWIKIVVWNMFEAEKLWTLAVGSSLLGLLGFCVTLFHKETSRITALTGLYLILFCTMLCCWQWYFPDFHGLRYFNAGAHLILVFIAIIIAKLDRNAWSKSKLAGGLLCVVMIVLSWYTFFDYARGLQSFRQMALFGQRSAEVQNEFWAGLDAFKELPEGSVIAARDHGRLAFFTDRPVQDIAGIIDPAILKHWHDGTLGAYLKERKVSFVLLPDSSPGAPTIYQAIHDQLHPSLISDAPRQEITGYRLYSIQ
jgi:hypothetical protein